MVIKATMESKTEGITRKSIKTRLETGVKSYVAFCLGPSIEKANSVLGKHQISLKFCFNRKYGWMETSVEIDYLQISLAKD